MSGTDSGHVRIGKRLIWTQVVPDPTPRRAGRGPKWVWQVWWGEVLVERGVCWWRWLAISRGWVAHWRAVRFVCSGRWR